VRATFEIETQVNIGRQSSFDSGPAEVVQGWTTTWTDNYINTDQSY